MVDSPLFTGHGSPKNLGIERDEWLLWVKCSHWVDRRRMTAFDPKRTLPTPSRHSA